jgi:hypothetical protein
MRERERGCVVGGSYKGRGRGLILRQLALNHLRVKPDKALKFESVFAFSKYHPLHPCTYFFGLTWKILCTIYTIAPILP